MTEKVEMLQGYLGEWTRVEILLPFKTAEEIQAGSEAIGYIKNARGPGKRHRYRGMTHSVQMPTVFQGAWWDKKKKKWVIDKLVVVILDLDIPYSNRPVVTKEASELKQQTDKFYTGTPQKDIWVTTYSLCWTYTVSVVSIAVSCCHILNKRGIQP